ncbi:MAG TPA: hypothetical protein VMK32_01095 [Burkholderiaceae bacterium]|nr:hypothetical protein [Burkholderiaceae bacterium]
MDIRKSAIALVAALACAFLSCAAAEPKLLVRDNAVLESRSDGMGMTTYWGVGASYEIVGPGITVFFLRRAEGGLVAPMIRVAYVGDAWIHAQSVTFTVGERSYGPFEDAYSRPTRLRVGSFVVESLMLPVDTDEKWRMLEGIGEAAELGRPVVVVFDGDVPYGIEVDSASKRATESAIRGFRSLQSR